MKHTTWAIVLKPAPGGGFHVQAPSLPGCVAPSPNQIDAPAVAKAAIRARLGMPHTEPISVVLIQPGDPVGLCRACRHVRRIPHPRGGVDYYRCGLAETDPAFPKFPPLPVYQCHGYEGVPTPDRIPDDQK